jgi:predicted nucleic acid-binding protein
MRRVFADSLDWIAIASPRDQWHARTVGASQALKGVQIVTTEEVLTEFLNAFRYNATLRRAAATTVRGIQADPGTVILPQSRHSFLAGLTL